MTSENKALIWLPCAVAKPTVGVRDGHWDVIDQFVTGDANGGYSRELV